VSGADATQGFSDWKSLEAETPEDYRSRIRKSALSRVKPEQFSRNWKAIQAAYSPNRKP
jgi:hypothetical protein